MFPFIHCFFLFFLKWWGVILLRPYSDHLTILGLCAYKFKGTMRFKSWTICFTRNMHGGTVAKKKSKSPFVACALCLSLVLTSKEDRRKEKGWSPNEYVVLDGTISLSYHLYVLQDRETCSGPSAISSTEHWKETDIWGIGANLYYIWWCTQTYSHTSPILIILTYGKIMCKYMFLIMIWVIMTIIDLLKLDKRDGDRLGTIIIRYFCISWATLYV